MREGDGEQVRGIPNLVWGISTKEVVDMDERLFGNLAVAEDMVETILLVVAKVASLSLSNMR